VSHARDENIIASTRNTARFFTETRHVAWALLVATVLWGAFSYWRMPKRKDPEIPVRFAAAVCIWPGAPSEKMEELVTRKMELKVAENSHVERVESLTRPGISVVYVTLDESTRDMGKEFDDVRLKLDSATPELPQGASPIQFKKDFGDTATLMLTVTTPKVSEVEVALRARTLRRTIESARAQAPPELQSGRATLVVSFPQTMNVTTLKQLGPLIVHFLSDASIARDVRPIEGPGFVGFDAQTSATDETILNLTRDFVNSQIRISEINPDVWLPPAIIRDPAETEAKLALNAGVKYSYDELDDLSDRLQRALQAVPQVAKVTRTGVREQRVYLTYSQERLASYGVQTGTLGQILGARNIVVPGGTLEIDGKNLVIQPSGEFKSEKEIGDLVLGASTGGVPVYLRDVMDISREYESPPSFLNYYSWTDAKGVPRRSRAVTLAVFMRSGEQVEAFGKAVNKALADVEQLLPEDLIVARTSDQAQQVRENIDLFMTSLYEAIALVVLVGLVGFWEWRSAAVLALSIPLTIAMTYGFMHLLGIDLQQISIASLIIALGLLVDDPVVAGDAIKRELAGGKPPLVAAWLGPTKLATAILFATITNIVAYLPFLTLTGDVGRFIFSLPVVLTCSLVASRLVSMTFIPLLGYYLLRPSKKAAPTIEERRTRGVARVYYRAMGWAIDHRWVVLFASIAVVVGMFASGKRLKSAFFPKDLSYLSYVDVWLPEDAPLGETNMTAIEVERAIREVASKEKVALESVTTFLGGGGPRFWFSVNPELQQLNYAQVVVRVKDKRETEAFVAPLQRALSHIPGARIDVRQLENGKPVGIPLAVRISGEDMGVLRQLAEKAKAMFRAIPECDRVRDDWGSEGFSVKLDIDPDRASIAGISNYDVAVSSSAGLSGTTVGTLREGDKQIPIVIRLRPFERGKLADLQNLYVYSSTSPQKVPLRQVADVRLSLEPQKIRRRDHMRTITVSAFPVSGRLPSEVTAQALPSLQAFAKTMPPGYKMEIGGELEEQTKGFTELAIVMVLSVVGIYMALVLQFKNAVKPLIVFAAIPFGIGAAVASLSIMGSPFGFIAFLAIISLIGVIVSHIIVLFDQIEEMREKGEPLREALLDAGIVRMRPVLITVGATVFGLVPLAVHGGPLWEPLCYAQIGGLTFATLVTLVIVPVLYAVFVKDLKAVDW
jgi:multidrug efflux pump